MDADSKAGTRFHVQNRTKYTRVRTVRKKERSFRNLKDLYSQAMPHVTAHHSAGWCFHGHDQSLVSDMEMFLDVLGHHFSIEKIDDPVRVIGIIR